ncbi:hypothetical protein [Odoribacter lunatus]|uniref:hypothetical protein n=1 Tax=Odoribacter lunatus TaxID=2941335 RepID=UPI0020422AFB|nr:hypothetical protein [Odoribacter lunatus]
MLYILIGIAGLLVIVALFTFFSKRTTSEETENTSLPDAECCGAHAVCEKGLKKMDTHIDYFEDEELDAMKGIPADAYTPEQLDRFRDVLYTLRKEEITDWFISLEKREIQFPEILKIEALDLLEN